MNQYIKSADQPPVDETVDEISHETSLTPDEVRAILKKLSEDRVVCVR